MPLIIGGDVGGTKTYLGLYSADGNDLTSLRVGRFVSADFDGPAQLLGAFIDASGQQPDRIVLGVPGPVSHGSKPQPPVTPVNLPWTIDPATIAGDLGVAQVSLLNDLEATAYGTLALTEDDLVEVNAGVADPTGGKAVIAAGTGLGEAGLAWHDGRHIAVPSEGGHASFAPGTEHEASFWRWLYERHGHVSWERVVSGMGLVNIYRFLVEESGQTDVLQDQFERQGEHAGIISTAARQDVPLAREALDMFVSLYGAEAGNLALKFLATGGVYVGGGIAPQIADELCTGTFMQAFCEKGRVSDMILRKIPVHIIKNDNTALLGAAYYGARLAHNP